MNCWHCDRPAHALCQFCGRAVCKDHFNYVPPSSDVCVLGNTDMFSFVKSILATPFTTPSWKE